MAPPAGPATGQPLWAVTTYFNPQHYARRRANYRLFRRRLPLPLLTVEWAADGRFELEPGEADVLVCRRGGDVMWQKERLLNLALAALPAECRKVVWIDCDILIGHDYWPAAVGRALDRWPLVQAFGCHHDMPRGVAEEVLCDPDRADFARPSLAADVARGRPPAECLKRTVGRIKGGCSTGIVWAARREVLEAHGFYDRCITGGGDRALACAAYGCFDELTRAFALNDRQHAHYLAWAEPFHRTVRGEVGVVDGPVFHLWHGAVQDRRYVERHYDLQRFAFDPEADVRVGGDGVFYWNSAKPELHRYLREYFAARRENG